MKKILILTSAVVVACGLQAASFSWGFSSDSIQDSTGAYIDGGTALLYLGTVAASENAFDASSATLLASGGQNADYTYGTANAGTTIDSAALSSTAAGQAYSLILLEKTGVTSLDGYEGNYILVTGSSEQGVNPMDDTDTWGVFQTASAYSASAWKTMTAGGDPGNVPEPTSGLLLLLGVAGLALKRKHA